MIFKDIQGSSRIYSFTFSKVGGCNVLIPNLRIFSAKDALEERFRQVPFKVLVLLGIHSFVDFCEPLQVAKDDNGKKLRMKCLGPWLIGIPMVGIA